MPINRDGKHWCSPTLEQPDENGEWVCPDCETVWWYTEKPGYPLWLRKGEDLPAETTDEGDD